ncbi:hypothetical protein [Croceimicrobium sp.]|uniref:hypothetical protein n=1 Tax=Croceimicrobium sp. TaxID=2828340 RepID=UPI003BAAE71D
MRKGLRLLLVLALPGLLSAQYQFRHLNNFNYLEEDSRLYTNDSVFHTGIRPFNRSKMGIGTTTNPKRIEHGWWNRKLWHERLIKVDAEDYAFSIDPIFNFQYGYEENEDYRFINTRGFILEGRIGQKLSFYSTFLENQARFPAYISNFVRLRRVIPGQGSLTRPFGEGGYDYSFFTGELSYRANKYFTFTAGQGRNFFGEGYRSMLLSDAGFSYPFFRIETDVWKFKYINLWAQLYDTRKVAQVNAGILAKKYLSSHLLSIALTDRWNLGIFESIVYGDTNQLQGLDASFLNPIVFYRPVEFAVGSRGGNALMGLQSSYKLKQGRMVYGQFILDEFNLASITGGDGSWVNKYGWQLGFKDYDAWGIKGWFQRVEYNAARPYTYSHRMVLTNYAHYGSPLAHPWGANFHEVVFQNIYKKDRWEAELHLNYGVRANDPSGENWGSDLFLSYETRMQDEGNEIAQGAKGNYFFLNFRLAYLVNPASGLKLETGFRYRDFETTQTNTISPILEGRSLLFIFGLRTELYNAYYDL